ncbi:hypothetical protein [Bradyrhizobium retamae]|uniref:Uncharacterized protein n=1 Tax=Bradyrhizobium retamae TaxID=1300035 RepID=A0A0R3MNN9_9BRAD|nr:hypothetical protein [Bradyrhizobium retamae]KRR19088.1 hypothetical protein CQ13_34530 [Bradyrhizobium retamae]
MDSATTLPDAASVQPRPLRLLGLYLFLIIIAAIEAFEGLSHLPMLFGDASEVPGHGIDGAIIKAYVISHPVLALAALGFATVGRLHYAVIALGALVLMNWLNYMPSVVRHGFDFSGISAFQTPVQVVAFPLMAACAIALAARKERLGLATLLVSIPTLIDVLAVIVNVLGVIVFAIGIMIYGF